MRVSVKYNIVGEVPNQAPIISPIDNQTNIEGDTISLQVNATDPELNNITYGASGLPSGLTINTSTGLISGTINPGTESGSPYTITVTATDDGSPSEQSSIQFSWTVGLANQAPVISPVSNQTNNEGDVVSLQIDATDPELNNITYGATNLPSGLTINTSTGLISGTIDAGTQSGSPYTVTVTATDDGSPSEQSSIQFTWTVGIANQAPVITPISNQTNDEGDVISLQVNATDPELDNITYGATGLPTGLSINTSTGLISGTIGDVAATGSPYTVTITATDDGSPSEQSSIQFTWTVAAVNAAPIITPISTQNDNEGDVISLQINATDPELDNITYGATNLPTGLNINTSTGLISGTISAGAGSGSPYTVTITATDDGSPSQQSSVQFTWNVSVAAPVDTSLYDSSNNQIPASIVNGDIPASHYAFGSNGAGTGVRVEFGTSCTSIGDYAFGSNTILGSTGAQMNIGPNITTISSNAFYYTQGFNATASLVIPNSVTSIGDYAFGGSSARVFYIDVPATAWIGSSAFYNDTFASNRIMYVSSTYLSQYNAAWQSAQAYNSNGSSTIVNWNNYPNPIPN